MGIVCLKEDQLVLELKCIIALFAMGGGEIVHVSRKIVQLFGGIVQLCNELSRFQGILSNFGKRLSKLTMIVHVPQKIVQLFGGIVQLWEGIVHITIKSW
ncbi:hypothetical protein OR571_02345 [Psychrobacillus sp. NEAU-3TGS]|uniref:hypothetical protein n=1 Tax=Psychrobacillus sp. NEAU-3TGS TaxID=2995412 RepID=UPI00249630A5|nr:hypothetical protein [Psychrobacillus sp. NEAU-3TGS]MDI2586001.1 hypothetical protein [Psychrobacillus sp. NEAU-3TGS]